jgi:hypothetical protein
MKYAFLTTAAFGLAWLFACGARSEDPGTDSTTQFWMDCDEDRECANSSCICGHCSTFCNDQNECDAFARGTLCVPSSSIARCELGTAQNICAPKLALNATGEPDGAASTVVDQALSSGATQSEVSSQQQAPASAPTWDTGWVTGDAEFAELKLAALEGIDHGRYTAVDAGGNIYLVVVTTADNPSSEPSDALLKLDADGQLLWMDSFSGTSLSLAVNTADGVYQSRELNGAGLVDRYTIDGEWLWSKVLYNHPDVLSVHAGADGSAYAWTSPDNYLWKLDLDGEVQWRWNPEADAALSQVQVDSTGTVYLDCAVSAEVPFFPPKGDPAPDQMLLGLDESGAEQLRRRYVLAHDLHPTGPSNLSITADGNLLGASDQRVSLYAPNGDTLWNTDLTGVVPPDQWLVGTLSAGRCVHCAYTATGLYAFDAEGNLAQSVILPASRQAQTWAVDDADDVYVAISNGRTGYVDTLMRYPAGAGWSSVSDL